MCWLHEKLPNCRMETLVNAGLFLTHCWVKGGGTQMSGYQLTHAGFFQPIVGKFIALIIYELSLPCSLFFSHEIEF